MTIYDEIKTELEHSPLSRERRFRAKAMRELVLRKLGYEGQMFLPMDLLDDYGKHFESYMRVWRDVLQNEPQLRGKDYGDGEALAQKFEIETLGMEVGYHRDVKLAV